MTTLLRARPVTARSMPDVVDQLGRRGLLIGSVATAGVAVLGGCGGAATPVSGSTRTVPTTYGPVDVPAQPRRIVTVSYNTPFQLQAVGVEPVGALDYEANYDQLAVEQVEMLRRTTTVGTFGSPDLERIAALAPDLIVGEAGEVEQELAESLGRIAPAVMFRGATRGDWPTVCTAVADAAGAGEALGAARSAYAAEIARLRDRYSAVLTGRRWVSFSFGDDTGEFSIQYPTGISGAMLSELGASFVPAVGAERPDRGYLSYSLERLSLLEPADVAVYPLAADGSQYPQIAEITASELFTRLPVARAGRTFGLTDFYNTTDHRTAMRSLTELERTVLARL